MTPAEMRRRYESGEPLRALAAEHGVTRNTIRRMLDMQGVPIRSRGGSPPRLDLHEIVILYYDERLSCASIGRRLGCSAQAIHQALERVGFPRRPPNTPSPLRAEAKRR